MKEEEKGWREGDGGNNGDRKSQAI